MTDARGRAEATGPAMYATDDDGWFIARWRQGSRIVRVWRAWDWCWVDGGDEDYGYTVILSATPETPGEVRKALEQLRATFSS